METKKHETGAVSLKYAPRQGGFRSAIVLLIFAAILIGGCANEKAAGIHLNSGIAFLESQQYSSALKELVEAQKLNPDDPVIHYYLGILYHVRGLPKETIRELEKAISLKPDYSDAYNYLGLVYDGQGQYDQAIASFKKAVANVLYETPSFAWNNMGWSYFKKGDFGAAAEAFKEAIRLEPNTFNHAVFENNIGRSLLEKGDFDSAISHFNQVLKISPDFIEARYWMGKCFQAQNKKYAALKEYRTVMAEAPNTELSEKAKKAADSLIKSAKRK